MTLERAKKITEGTFVPLSLVGIIIATVWAVASDYSQTKANASDAISQVKENATAHEAKFKSIDKKQDKYLETVQSIDKRLSRLEWKAGIR